MKSFVVATHSFAFGTSQALKNYLERQKKEFIFLEKPLFATPLRWALDSLNIFRQVFSTGKKYDIYVGSNRLNTYIGIILKKTGRVGKVVYLSPDWVENRFKNRVLNMIYDWLDYYCVKNSDLVWNSSPVMKIDAMMRKRSEKGYPKSWIKKQIQLPDGCDYFPYIPLDMVDRFKIGFIGHLREGMGGELLVGAFRIIKKRLPKAQLILMGSGPKEKNLRTKAKGLDIEFTGYVGDINDVYNKLSKCAFAVAPYRDSEENMSRFTDPGKVKVYLSLSLPVVITDVPAVSKEVGLKRAGVVVKDDVTEFANAVIKLMKDDKLLNQFRKNAHDLAKKYSWDKIFDRALSFL